MARVVRGLKAINSSLKVINFTFASPYEDYLGSAIELPTAEPGTDTFSHTIVSGDLSTTDPVLSTVTRVMWAYINGQNLSGSSATYNWRVLVNDSSVGTGSASVLSNYYYGCSLFYTGQQNLGVGDKVSVRVWATVAGVYIQRFAMQDLIQHINPKPEYQLYYNIRVSNMAQRVNFTSGTLNGSTYGIAMRGFNATASTNSSSTIVDTIYYASRGMPAGSLYTHWLTLYYVGISGNYYVSLTSNTIAIPVPYAYFPSQIAWEDYPE